MTEDDVGNGPNPRTQRALHRFAQQLEDEVREALDAAQARRLAPFESIQRCCEYLWARHVAPSEGRALPKRLLRKPDGLTVNAALAAGLKAVEPHLLDACVRQIQFAIELFRPFGGKPFPRKRIVVGRGGDKTAAQKAVSDEEKALERLEQAGVDIVHLFRAASERLEAQATGGRKKRPVKPEERTPLTLTPPQLAKQMGVHPDKIYVWIRSGELRATDTATKRGGKPRYHINRQDAEDFQRRRQNSPPPPPSPRRKRNWGTEHH